MWKKIKHFWYRHGDDLMIAIIYGLAVAALIKYLVT